jgi:hypothetical protein
MSLIYLHNHIIFNPTFTIKNLENFNLTLILIYYFMFIHFLKTTSIFKRKYFSLQIFFQKAI